ncbi:hypothetical protein [Marinicella rhabdoformis]|uniref:hypothetical protein n=1 Tax=Marinicella rhabdoformis TaxID=2580566 RepID=UPI0012AECC00|nr:hypothetical protein [Marinicella rhabdoformis]
MKFKNYVLMMTCLLGADTQAQSLWGAEASQGQTEGQFGNPFVETGDSQNLSTDSWTALSIYDSSQAVTPGSAYWTRNLEGYSQGAYWGGTTPVNSPSQVNGVALFDSDFLDNAGIPGNFAQGTSPTVHRGELISPAINIEPNTDSLIMLKFYTHYRDFAIDNFSIAFSIDNNLSWGPEVDIRQYHQDLTEGFVYVPFPVDTLAGAVNLVDVRFKFIFEGDYYFALVDDVTLMIYDEAIFDTIFKDGFESTVN